VGQLSAALQRKRIEDEKSTLLEAVSRQRAELRALTQQLAALQEIERATLARELHDRVGQNLTALDFNLTFVQSQLPEDSAGPGRERLTEALKLVEETSETIRNVMADLRPPVLDEYGLVEALNWYAGRFSRWSGLRVIVKGQPFEPRLAELVESALFRIAQEALTNVGKHAQASEIVVTVAQDANKVRMTIADDGIGFADRSDPEATEESGWGLLTMAERADAIDGQVWVESEPDQGTRVIVEVERKEA
jgi:two-component system sensor histidine kinase UhpB